MIIDNLLSYAKSFVGQEELGNNGGWKDKVFEKAMRAIGWMTGWAWCASFVRMVYLHIAEVNYGKDSMQYKDLNSVLSHSVMRTWANAKKHPRFLCHTSALRGGIIIWNHGKGKGHTGITESDKTELVVVSVEGNTNKAGSREGKFVMLKHRNIIDTSFVGCIEYLGFDERV